MEPDWQCFSFLKSHPRKTAPICPDLGLIALVLFLRSYEVNSADRRGLSRHIRLHETYRKTMDKVFSLLVGIFFARWLMMVAGVVVVTADAVEQLAEGKCPDPGNPERIYPCYILIRYKSEIKILNSEERTNGAPPPASLNFKLLLDFADGHFSPAERVPPRP